MKKILISVFLTCSFLCVNADKPWKVCLTCPKEKIDLNLDLYEESISVPGLEMFGPMNGFMAGNIYGVWYVTGFKIQSDREAIVKVGNDLGSENQTIHLIQNTDTTWIMKFEGQQVVKRVKGKKLVKIPSEFTMKVK